MCSLYALCIHKICFLVKIQEQNCSADVGGLSYAGIDECSVLAVMGSGGLVPQIATSKTLHKLRLQVDAAQAYPFAIHLCLQSFSLCKLRHKHAKCIFCSLLSCEVHLLQNVYWN